ncbi:MAG TPA: hypothetical protein VGB23_09345, partial [Nitrospirota bacterium]
FHLGILKSARLIKDRKVGRWSYYDLDFSDMLSRVVVPTALERTNGGVFIDDRRRLKAFQATKVDGKPCIFKSAI